ncbi:ankyrin repeat domain-containing protein [Yinghuangia aomiensis]
MLSPLPCRPLPSPPCFRSTSARRHGRNCAYVGNSRAGTPANGLSAGAATIPAMGFFDGLVTPDPEPQPETRAAGSVLDALSAPGGRREQFPPENHFVPAWLEHHAEAGRGTDVRIRVNGWQVWRNSATLRLDVFVSRVPARGDHAAAPHNRSSAGGLRFGLRLADGRRITTLDGEAWPQASSAARPTLTVQPGMGGVFRYTMKLHLSQLPPEGELWLVTEWPDQGVPETWTELDGSAVVAAAARAVEVWPDIAPLEPGAAPQRYGMLRSGSASRMLLASPPLPQPYQPPSPPPVALDRGDWAEMPGQGFGNLVVVKSRLAHGADPDAVLGNGDSVLHLAAAQRSGLVVAELARRVRSIEPVNAMSGETPLWAAVCRGHAEAADALLAAGAKPWTPVLGGRSAGSLALRTKLAPLFEDLSGCVPLTEAERAEQAAADAHAAVFKGMYTEGVSVAFVGGIDEEEAVHRLGSTPERSPVLDLAAEPGPHGTGPGGFDPHDWDTALRFLGVTGVDGGCVVIQPSGYRASTPAVLMALSPGGRAYSLYFNPKGGTFTHRSVDGADTGGGELGMSVREGAPELQWLYRFWDWDREPGMESAAHLAYAAAMAGLRITDATAVSGPPRRWVELPEGSPLLR